MHSFEDEQSASAFFAEAQKADNDTLLRVQVESSVQKTTFYLPVSLMLQREIEMNQAALNTSIDSERWSSSLLFKIWREDIRRNEDEINLHLSPETAMEDHSALRWKPWLTTCIRAYYNTGTIRVPDNCFGSEILLALEYFGILTTSPDAFVFDSYDAYERVKAWSDYFTHRHTVVSWVLEDLRIKSKASRKWVTSPHAIERVANETLLQVKCESASVLAGGIEKSGYPMISCKVVHELFADRQSEHLLTREMPSRMRKELLSHLKRSLPAQTHASFDIQEVTITRSNGRSFTEFRPVLSIQSIQKEPSREDYRLANRSLISDDTSGTGIAAILGLQDDLSEMGRLNKSERASSNSLEFSEVSSRNRSVERRMTFDPPSRVSRSSAASFGIDNVTVLKSQSRSTIEQSSSRPYLERRSPQQFSIGPSEENSRCPEPDIPSRREFLQQIDAIVSSPLQFINTSFGDLRSVTSVLSAPSALFAPSAVPTPIVDEQTRETPRISPTVPKSPEPTEAKVAKPALSKVNIEKVVEPPENEAKKESIIAAPFSYWDSMIAIMCDPVSENDRSPSPVQQVILETNDGSPLLASMCDGSSKSGRSPSPAEQVTLETNDGSPLLASMCDDSSSPSPVQQVPLGRPASTKTRVPPGCLPSRLSVEGMTATWLRTTIMSGSDYETKTAEPSMAKTVGCTQHSTKNESAKTDAAAVASAKTMGNTTGTQVGIKFAMSAERDITSNEPNCKAPASNSLPDRLQPKQSAEESVRHTNSLPIMGSRAQAKRPPNVRGTAKRQSRQEELATTREDQKGNERLSSIGFEVKLPPRAITSNEPNGKVPASNSLPDRLQPKQSAGESVRHTNSQAKRPPNVRGTAKRQSRQEELATTREDQKGNERLSSIGFEVKLPPRVPRRLLATKKIPIARKKKHSASAAPP
jgi:hypothetical protein